ncbi:alpha/beta hydrolase [Dinghuibacter silviterrae]|uniref:Esterase/lipase n=1 Tax=Dinghuibacter silviterrae TaxID=1539049 RepID=A0A4R8DNV7_9BACT|nr:alpha/beta fold hydrolase [Dinghuibacter silviterrae]TDW99723.1 esterase/lipase [Dinghuibacter silviterrae]
MRKGWLIVLGVLIVLVLVYCLGPHPQKPVYNTQLPVVPADAAGLEQYVAGIEARHHLKPNNEARIVWSDSLHRKTPFVILYLHGFSACQEEGNPVHRDMAALFGCNLYLSRLAEHGVDTPDAMVNLTVDGLWNSAKEAYAIARQLGDSVILMGTSTGGSLALQLAATYPDDPIKGLILMSPNIAINNPAAFLLDKPWGLQIARMVTGSKFYPAKNPTAAELQYWNSPYRLEALTQLQEMLDTKMVRATFEKVVQPTLMMYFYKDETHQDSTVKVAASLRMMDQLGSPPVLKRSVDIPGAGRHVLGCGLISHDVPAVESAVDTFAIKVLRLQPR